LYFIKLQEGIKLKITTINLPEQYIESLDYLVDLGYFPSRSESIRQALKQFLSKEQIFVNEISSSVFCDLKDHQAKCLIGG